MRSTFKVLFYLKCNAPKKDGLIPVMCRITINGKIAQFSCKLDVEEKSWNVELGRVSGRSIAAQEANRMLDKIRVGINQAYQKIADRDNYVTAEKVRNAYLGLGMNHETLLAVFRQHNEDYGKQVGKLKSPRSYWKYCTMYKHLSEFVEKRYKVSDIAFKELTPAFITDFELFLRVEKNHCNNTVWSYYLNYYNDTDHQNIANTISEIANCKWIVSYDNVPFITSLYSKYRQQCFELNYSASNSGKGKEIMVFCDGIVIPKHKLFNHSTK